VKLRTLLVAPLLLAVGAAGAAPSWRPAVELSPSQRALGPELAVNDAGDAIVVWNREEGADCPTQPASLSCIHIVEVVSRARGSSAWSAPVEVARPGVGNTPRVAIDPAGNAALVWVHDIGEDRVLQATIRPGPSGSWPNANDLSGTPFEIRNHAIALDASGSAVAVWAQRDATTFYVVGDFRVAARGYWEAPVALSSLSGQASAGPSLAFALNSQALVAWIENGQARLASGQATTGVWVTPVTLAAGGGDGTDVDVALNFAGDAVVVWSWGANVVQAAVRRAGGSWSGPVRLGTGTDVEVALDGTGDAVAVWLGGSAGNLLQSARHARGAAGWTRPFQVAATASSPRIAMDGTGNAVAVWTQGANRVIAAGLRPTALGTWVRRGPISGPGASAPSVAVSPRGDATAVWNRAAPPRVVVESRSLTGSGPVLARLRVPKKTLVQFRTTFSVVSAAWASPLVGVPSWRFGDGTSAAGPTVSHSYASAGSYAVTVTARDAAGGLSTLTGTISVSALSLVNTVRPTVQGQARVGSTLTCKRGSWLSKTPVQYMYRWLRNGQPLTGATARLYRTRAADARSRLSCRVTAANSTRSVTLTSPGVRVA
jgi:hypothetical protein